VSVDDGDEDRYAATPRSPVPVAPKKRFNWLRCVKKQTGEENPLMVSKVGASPSDLAHSRVGRAFCSRVLYVARWCYCTGADLGA